MDLIYGVNGFQTRSLVAQQDSEEIRFFVGTQVINQKNQIHLLQLDDEGEKIKSKIFSHDGEIWKLRSCPNDKLLASVYSSNLAMKTAILKIPDGIFDDSQQEILEFESTEVLDIDTDKHGSDEIKTTEFHSTNSDVLATVTESKLLILSRAESKTKIVAEVNAKNGKFAGGKFYNNNQFLVMHENTVKSFDTRDSNHIAFEINAHIQPVRDLDINPNKAFTLATVGDDCSLKVWDVRNNKQPVFSRRDHQHWITSVSFNKFHDQLILTASTDSSVLLTCAASCSSESVVESKANSANVNEDSPVVKTQLADGLLEKFEQHEDSVYCAEWSSLDPWIFCSVSWDGRVVIKKVPKKYKYQILL